MIWLYFGTATMLNSALASGLTMLLLYRKWDVFASSVRFIFFCFFIYLFLWCLARSIYYIHLCTLPISSFIDIKGELTNQQMQVIGPHVMLRLQQVHTITGTAVLIAGDVGLFGVACWMFPMIYELSKIVYHSMDRGLVKEQKQMKRYFYTIHFFIVCFVILEISLALVSKGYTDFSRYCIFGVYILQFIGLFYMIVVLIALKLKGKKYEAIHGTFIASPIYQRLKRIMIVYALFSFQFQLATVIQAATDLRQLGLLEYMAISSLFYHSTGFALSVITSCSLECVLNFCGCCFPPEVLEAHAQPAGVQSAAAFGAGRGRGGQRRAASSGAAGSMGLLYGNMDLLTVEPPTMNPVFVFTDIESSSALWGMENGAIMQKATEIHDDLLRSLLRYHGGYEITTCGDAFQLAFHTIPEAVAYCLQVQRELHAAPWPKKLHGLVPASAKEYHMFKKVFQGLRVRMGIHDACADDGDLVSYVHPVTHRLTYTGASEVIANEVGDVGNGGQILITQRIYESLKLLEKKDQETMKFLIDPIGPYHIESLDIGVELYQLNPKELAGRKKKFKALNLNDTNSSNHSHRKSQEDAQVVTPPPAGEVITAVVAAEYQRQGSQGEEGFASHRMSNALRITRANSLKATTVETPTAPAVEPFSMRSTTIGRISSSSGAQEEEEVVEICHTQL